MDFEKDNIDPYALLGAPSGASIEVCKATYKALAKIFHPDVFVGDKAFAEKRMAELNAAYKFLNNPSQKKIFDDAGGSPEGQHYKPQSSSDEFSEAEKVLQKSWDFACEYHPELLELYNNLRVLDSQTAFLFMAVIVEQKLYHQARDLVKYLQNEFLISKFSNDKEIQDLATYAIIAGELKFAQQLNKALKILGPESKKQIYKKLVKDFPSFANTAFSNVGIMGFQPFASTKQEYVKTFKGMPIYKITGSRTMFVGKRKFEGILAAEKYISSLR